MKRPASLLGLILLAGATSVMAGGNVASLVRSAGSALGTDCEYCQQHNCWNSEMHYSQCYYTSSDPGRCYAHNERLCTSHWW